MRHRRIIAYILITSLSLGVFTSGLFVMSHYAKADSPDDYNDVYFVNVISYLEETGAFSDASLSGFADYVGSKLSDTEENENYLVCMIEDHGSIAISLFQLDPMNGSWCTVNPYLDYCGIGGSSGSRNNYCFASLRYVPGQSQYNFCVYSQNLFTQNQYLSNTAYSFTDQDSFTKYRVTGNIFDQRIEGRKCYWSKNLPAGSFSQYVTPYSCPKNLLYNNPLVHFNLVSFNIGIQQFVTINNQNVVRGYKDFPYGNLDGASSHVLIQYLSKDTNEFTEDHLRWSDLYTIDNISFYTDQLVNLEANDIGYAWKVSQDWSAFSVFGIVYKLTDEDPRITGVADNLPFYFEDNDYETSADNQLTEAWNQFNTYVENYNQTHVIPEQLADWLFETNGSKLFPVTVSVPGNIWLPDHGTAYTQHNWVWGGLNAATEAFAYDLFDVCICGSNNLNLTLERNYQLRYFVDDILDPMYNNVSTISFSELLDSFDVVIIVPEDEGYLHDLALTSNIAYCGSSGNSIVYQGTAITGNNLTGFAIVTERGISKQHLWNFNDGITKLYDLQVKYIDSEDKWKDSFLLWSASIFDMLNTLDGRLSSINDILSSWHFEQWFSDISLKLDRLIDNTSEEEGNYWYLALWNWVTQFKPSENNFVNALNNYDNNWDNFPELPEPTVLPLLPGD